MDKFNEDYFERGVEKGISLYENFHWIPEKSFLEAHWFIQHMNVKVWSLIIDFGCAKGFFVKALRILGYPAYGYDISEYALSKADPEFCSNKIDKNYDIGFCKDVLEHSENEEDLLDNLRLMRRSARKWLLIVPLADKGKYIIPEYEKDKTHLIRLSAQEWTRLILKAGYRIDQAGKALMGLKENWPNGGDLFLKLS